MLKQTTTKQISDALSNNLLQVAKAEIYYKTSHKTDVITDYFLKIYSFFASQDVLWIVLDGTTEKIAPLAVI